jgi:hypothetical protein
VTPEGKIRQHLRKQVKAASGHHRKLGWIGRRNAPDEFIFWDVPPGCAPIACFVECKAPSGAPTEAQQREIGRLRAGGFRVEVAASELFVDFLVSELTTSWRELWIAYSKGSG